MTVALPDNVLRQAGLDERQARIEFACWLFDSGRVDLWPAAQMAGLARVEFEAELLKRGIAIYRYSEVDFVQDMATAEKLGL
ncbi:MAG TPA: UPF0175 family protein [Phycisphaerae bacterium]|nr:UPF0175 family protein [Phycisphaerae bacterium]